MLDTTPALIDEKIHMFLAEGLTFGESHPDEDEFLNVERMGFDELLDRVMAGEIKDAKTAAVVMKVKLLKERERHG